MKERGFIEPLTEFSLPPAAPTEVQEADDAYRKVAGEYVAARRKLRELQTTAASKVEAAHRASAEARVKGTLAPKQNANQVRAKVEQEIANQTAEVAALADATDKLGNELALKVGANIEEWIVAADAEEAASRGRLAAAIQDVRTALNDISAAKSAPAWLRAFSAGDAWIGEQPQYGVQPLTVDALAAGASTMDSFTPVERIVSLLDQVAKPTEEYLARHHRTVRALG